MSGHRSRVLSVCLTCQFFSTWSLFLELATPSASDAGVRTSTPRWHMWKLQGLERLGSRTYTMLLLLGSIKRDHRMGETDFSSIDMRSYKYCGLCIIGTISDMNYYKFNVLLDCGIV